MSKTGSDIVFRENPRGNPVRARYHEFSLDETLNALSFHRSIPSFETTPLYKMDSLAEYLGIRSLWIKDESSRFRLNTFKGLGPSYALAKWLKQKSGSGYGHHPTFDRVVWWCSNLEEDFSLVTAADGHYGCGVAWLASLCGCKARIFVPAGTSGSWVASIRSFGAEVEVIQGNYDRAVRLARQSASDDGSLFIQDTVTEYDEEIVRFVMQGYLTLIHEVYTQLPAEQRPGHILLQAGAGSFAAAAQAYLSNRFGENAPQLILVEPEGAACFYESFGRGDGSITKLDSHHTIMSGLNCGEPNRFAWKILRDESDGVLRCHDRVSWLGMRVLNQPLPRDPKIVSSESGAVGLGALFKICREEDKLQLKKTLGLNQDSVVLVFSTEGPTDLAGYRQGLWEDMSV